MEDLLANTDYGSRLIYNIVNRVLLFGGLAVAVRLWWYHRRNPPDRPALTAIILSRSWNTVQIIILLGSLFLLYFLAMFSGRLFYEEDIPLAQLVIALIIDIILIIVIVIINRKRGNNWTNSYGMGRRQVSQLAFSPIFYLAFIPVIMLATFLYHQILNFLDTGIELQEVAQVVSQELSWLEIGYILSAIFVAPIFEEIMFRGVVFPYLAKRVGFKMGAVMLSLLFMCLHFNLASAVPIFLFSMALCYIYWRTSSLWPCIGMHTIFNTITILALNVIS